MEQLMKGVLESCPMDVVRADFKNYLYIFNAKKKLSVEVEDGKVVKVAKVEKFKV